MHRDGRTRRAVGRLVSLAAALSPSSALASGIGSAAPLPSAEARTVEFVRRGAMVRLRSPECRKVLTDFRALDGRPLAERLASFALQPDEYLAGLAFRDGRQRPLCRAGAEMLTAPGAGRILVCPWFLRTAWRDRTRAEVYVIHEMLHTLGLGEHPPTPREITEQVEKRCAP